MVSSYTQQPLQPSPHTSIMSNNIITIMIFMHSAHNWEGAHYHIPAFKWIYFGVCTLNKVQVCPFHTVLLARYIILSTRYPSPSAPRPANTSQKSSSETFTRLLWTVSSHPKLAPIHDAYQPIINNRAQNPECSESWPLFVVSRCQHT